MASEIWTDDELEAAVAAYLQMLRLELAGGEYSKAAVARSLLAGPLSARTTIKQRMSNISAVLKAMGRPWIKGYDPLGNVGTASGGRIRKVIQQFDQPNGIPLPLLPPPFVGEARRLPPTGYWELVCNRAKWDGEGWLRSGETELNYLVSNHNRHEVQRGDLAVLRLNATTTRPASVYAILEVIEGAVERTDDDDRFYADKADASASRVRARLRLHQNLVDQPLAVADLPDEPDFRYLKTALQTSTIPLSLSAFKTIVRMTGLDPFEIYATRLAGDASGVAELEKGAASLDPVVRHRISRVIERGPIGNKVKAVRGHQCQLCEAVGWKPQGFVKRNGQPYAEAHHVQPVSGLVEGSLGAQNIMVLCPNHHRQAHYGQFDIISESASGWSLSLDGQLISVEKTTL